MERQKDTVRVYKDLLGRWIGEVADPFRLARAIPRYIGFFRDWRRYARLEGAEPLRLLDTYPRLYEKTPFSPFDVHYFYQDAWAFQKIHASNVRLHVDVASRVDLIAFLAAVTKVVFVELRPLLASLDNLLSLQGDILALPFKSGSVASLSCLHVAEHIGLGRYGDALDPRGTEKTCKELSRILARKGNLYFSLPVGRPRLCFNAHRIHSPQQILSYFGDLHLVEFSGTDDNGCFRRNIHSSILENSEYACGLFHFRKE